MPFNDNGSVTMQACNAKPHATGWATTCAIARFAVDHVWLLLILCCFGGAAVHAAPPYSNLRLSEYQKQDWQVEDGLPENNVRMIAQRPDGALLLATSSGLATFDGQRFQNVPINIDGLNDNEAVNAVLHEPNDDLWIGTDGRGVLHRTRSGTVNISERAGLYNERVRMLYLDGRKVLWIATQNGIERFADDRLERVPIGGMISGDITTPFAEDSHGGMFFVTSSGLFLWENGAARRYPLHTAGVGDPVAVYRDPQQNIWVGTMTAVLQLIPRGNSAHDASVQYDEVVRARVPSPVSTLVGDTSHNLWIGTRQDGLWRYGSDGVSHWTSHDGLPDNYIRSLYFDEEENLWIGMRSGGLSRWRKGPLAPYGEPEGFHATYSATALADSRGDLWLGTWGKGLFRRHNGKLTAMSPPGMPIATPIRALAEERRGHVWVGTWFDGVYRYDGKAFHHYLLGVESPGNAVSAILPDKSGGLWVGTYTGLFYFPSGEPDAAHSSHLLESKLITCMMEDTDGSILVGTSTGLYRVRDGKVLTVTGLPHPYILSLTLDSKGYMWTGTKAGGLASVHQERVTPLPSNGGLAPLLVNTAIEDDDGHLWLGTSRGIVRLLIAELQAVADGEQSQLSAVVLGKADGMRSSEIGGPSKRKASSIRPTLPRSWAPAAPPHSSPGGRSRTIPTSPMSPLARASILRRVSRTSSSFSTPSSSPTRRTSNIAIDLRATTPIGRSHACTQRDTADSRPATTASRCRHGTAGRAGSPLSPRSMSVNTPTSTRPGTSTLLSFCSPRLLLRFYSAAANS
jgi:ligand-binding sensor domain-containing protein